MSKMIVAPERGRLISVAGQEGSPFKQKLIFRRRKILASIKRENAARRRNRVKEFKQLVFDAKFEDLWRQAELAQKRK